MGSEEIRRFKGKLEEGVLSIEGEDGSQQTLRLADDVVGHLADLQGTPLKAQDEDGTEVEIVLDRIDGDEVEGHRFTSDRNLKRDVAPVIWSIQAATQG